LRLHLRTEDPTPPGSLYALLSAWSIGVRLLCHLRRLLDRLRRFLDLSEGLQVSAQIFSLLLCLFPSAALLLKLLHRLAAFILERGLCSFG
jgi:hypothetical protein